MKKILWLSHFIPFPPKGGNGYNLIRELSIAHDVTVLSFNQSSIISTTDFLQAAMDFSWKKND